MIKYIFFLVVGAMILIAPVAAAQTSSCDVNGSLITNLGIDNNNVEFKENCQYGCTNISLINLGKAGCKASDMEQFIILIFICAAIIIIYKVIEK